MIALINDAGDCDGQSKLQTMLPLEPRLKTNI